MGRPRAGPSPGGCRGGDGARGPKVDAVCRRFRRGVATAMRKSRSSCREPSAPGPWSPARSSNRPRSMPVAVGVPAERLGDMGIALASRRDRFGEIDAAAEVGAPGGPRDSVRWRPRRLGARALGGRESRTPCSARMSGQNGDRYLRRDPPTKQVVPAIAAVRPAQVPSTVNVTRKLATPRRRNGLPHRRRLLRRRA